MFYTILVNIFFPLFFFQSFLIIVWNFELYMLPVAVLIIFLWKYVEISITDKYARPQEEEV